MKRSDAVLRPDSARVVGRPHVPGDDPSAEGVPRLTLVVERILALSDDEVRRELEDVHRRFAARHRDLDTMLLRNATRVDHLLDGADDDCRRLVGAYLTQEHAYQSAAVTNPSMVAAPDQSGVAPGDKRFVLSLRMIGEGHISSMGFRTGIVTAAGEVVLDEAATLTETGERGVPVYERRHFATKLRELGADVSLTARVLDQLGRHFGPTELEDAISVLDAEPRAVTHESTKLMRWLAASNYLLRFEAATSSLQERLVWPEGPFESKGLEDARFVEFTEVDGSTTYYGTYTAYDGFEILPQLIETNDFCTFEMSTLSGASAQNKGMALFPRLVDETYMSLSRPDRENLHLLRSSDPRAWHHPSVPLRMPKRAWEIIQMGNCGSPIETEAGWLVLTHGVGPLRTYRIGAILLDLAQPSRIIGDLPEPLLEASEEERNGYVPNVVYSCGGMVHDDHLVVPYGVADQRTSFAVYSVSELLEALLASPPPSPRGGFPERRAQPQTPS
ncbi:MAG: GH130 [uncultured Acidimicrobiales bacterium]|uniref:GH130 n=1 Tax=uncultured Acidimicrobiales bacterium TaxID=310071 RepID=A0A6J4H8W9_9ACTN|nr:MAG: GH130 [uncultured Acidimicrobiales bacterium]